MKCFYTVVVCAQNDVIVSHDALQYITEEKVVVEQEPSVVSDDEYYEESYEPRTDKNLCFDME
jgi:hypothetical protein